MATVGVRELRQSASALLRRVVAGETIEVTDHGHPVARIVPLTRENTLNQLIVEGRASRTQGDLLSVEPTRLGSADRPLSDVLAELRADER